MSSAPATGRGRGCPNLTKSSGSYSSLAIRPCGPAAAEVIAATTVVAVVPAVAIWGLRAARDGRRVPTVRSPRRAAVAARLQRRSARRSWALVGALGPGRRRAVRRPDDLGVDPPRLPAAPVAGDRTPVGAPATPGSRDRPARRPRLCARSRAAPAPPRPRAAARTGSPVRTRTRAAQILQLIRVSTPSAITSRPRLCASAIVERTIASLIPPSSLRGDEAAVDLERLDRELMQRRERRVAGAEVVEVQPDPVRAHLGDDPLHPFGLLHQRALGDLEHERVRWQARPRRAREDLFRKRGSSSCRAETLTLIARRRPTRPARRQSASVASAVRSTCRPSGPIRPDSSAIGMKSAGVSAGQPSGQRASASRLLRCARSRGRRSAGSELGISECSTALTETRLCRERDDDALVHAWSNIA